MLKSVLVVDDDSSILRFMEHVLQNEGLDVTSVSNGVEALELLKVQAFQLVITDMRMPLVDGYDLVYTIKELYPGVPILLTTAHPVNTRVEKALRFESVLFLRKPFTVEEVKRGVLALLPRFFDSQAAA